MNKPLISLVSLAMVLSVTTGVYAYFGAIDDEDGLVTALAEADLIVVASTEYVSSTKDETIDKIVNMKILYDGLEQRKAKSNPPKAQPASAPAKLSTSQPTSAPADILVITPKQMGPRIPGLCPEPDVQIVFLKVVHFSPVQVKEYREQCIKEAERGLSKYLTPDVRKEVEGRIKGAIRGTEMFCRLSGDSLDVTPTSDVFLGKMFKEHYKVTKAEEIIGPVKALCAWRGLKTRQEKLDYLVKLLNDNPKNPFYLDNVSGLLKRLDAKLETKNGKYVATDAPNDE